MNLSKIMDSQISREQMMADYKAIDGMNLAEKKEKAAEYGIDSKKAADIQKAILLAMRDERSSRNEWDSEDAIAFMRLIDWAEQYKKVAEYLSMEKRGFAEFLAQFLYADLEKHGITKRWNVDYPIGNRPYGLTYSDVSSIKRYQAVKKFLNESSDEHKEQVNTIDAIKKVLDVQLVDFKNEYIERAKDWAVRMYKNLPNAIAGLKERRTEIKAKMDARIKELGGSWLTAYGDGLYREYDSRYEKIKREIAKGEGILRQYPTIESYLDMVEKDAIDIYNKNVTVLSEKINKWGVDVSKLVVKTVNDDPKFFEIRVSDGVHNLHARSIWAAEYSDKVTPHFRFIITDKK